MKRLSPLFALLRRLTLLALLLGAASPALAAKVYTDNGDGTVTDPTTGLTWMKCALGQTWVYNMFGDSCNSAAGAFTWDLVSSPAFGWNFAGHSDWRVPNIRELQTIVNRSYSPAIAFSSFPNTPSVKFWSTSAFIGSQSPQGWWVDFSDGSSGYLNRTYQFPVRMVRGTSPLGLLTIDRPNTDYVDQGDGSVTHTPTGLTWQRCALGQIWMGGTCSGTASTFDALSAKAVTSSLTGKTDWRLPTAEELVSLADYNKYLPAINDTLLPTLLTVGGGYFWSASPNAQFPNGEAWIVGFTKGDVGNGGISDPHQARLVRAGRAFGPSTLSVSKTGAGQVASSTQPGIDCGTICSAGYNLTGFGVGTTVTLNATPTSLFKSWTGACTGTTPSCVLDVGYGASVTANFWDSPLISGLPPTLDFGLQGNGVTSAAQSVKLSNSGSLPLTISSIVASANYSVSQNCGGGLNPSGSCTLDISFTPSAVALQNGTVIVTSNAPGSSQTIALSGTGQGSPISMSPAVIMNFPAQGLGVTSPAQPVSLYNAGPAVVHIASIVANGNFGISSNTCGATLAPLTSCIINVTFTPTTIGSNASALGLVVTSDALNGPNEIVLTGSGLPIGVASPSATALSFGQQTLNTTSALQSVTVTNTGSATLGQIGILASGDFSQTSDCASSLGMGAFCSISVSFTPTALGARSGTLSISSNAAISPRNVALSGSGRSALAPICGLSAAPAKVLKGQAATLTASCSPVATSWSWTGGTCGARTAATCTVSPLVSTAYSVTGSNSYGDSTAGANVTVHTDLTPILMLLLD
jgi:hypothetical protein